MAATSLRDHARAGRWDAVAGAVGFVAVLAAGYYYNLTFVQLGLIDLGTRVVGLPGATVSASMAGFALAAFAAAVAAGVTLDRRGAGGSLHAKVRVLAAVVAVQWVLTVLAPLVETGVAYAGWLLACATAIGVGMPVTFALAVDLVPVPDRGAVAAAATGAAFFAAAVYPMDWRVGEFAGVLVPVMAPGVLLFGALASGKTGVLDRLDAHSDDHAVGRFCRPDPVETWSASFWVFVALLFAAFFVDSLGFLRIVETPVYVLSSWQSPDVGVRVFIGATHVVAAAAAGVLYTAFGRRALVLWVFGLFAFTHLLYTYDARVTAGGAATALLLPGAYAAAVSFYTTLTFALWPDLSTPATAGTHAALGVGVAGWLATFLSTALALASEAAAVPLATHLSYVNALTLLVAVGFPVALYLRRVVQHGRAGA
jgi:MFS family permease